MHNTIIGSTGIDQDNHLAHDNSYSNEQWVDMSAYNNMGMTTYGGEYYGTPVTHGLPSESIGMAPPPVPHQMHSQPHNNYASHLPHPLIIPNQVPWPSLRTNPSQSYAAPPVPIPPASAPMRQPPRLPTINTSQPRKTLTDEDRRNMCLFHEDNPHAKQTEIGQKFGVERSTVSKVLRRKELYLNMDSQGGSPVKKSKGKSPPDIERALANWVRGQQKKGVVVSDSQMEEKAKVFCTGSDSPLKTITASWIEKFKQKHNIGPGKLIRRASETAIPDNARLDTGSPLLSTSQTPGGISPASPINQTTSPQPSSAIEKSESKESLSTGFMDFETNGYRHPHSQSSTSLSSAVTDPPSSTFSAGAFSPGSQFNFSPDPNSGMFGDRNQMPGNPNFQRPRSQTVPDLGHLDYINQSQSSEPLTPKYSQSGTAPSSALESPAHEIPAPPFGNLDSAISPPTPLHHVSSNSSLTGRSSCSGVAVSGTTLGSSPSSPTQEDARRAADTLLSFMQQFKTTGLVDQNDFLIVLGLTEKLGLQSQQQMGILQTNSASQGFGGLSRIPEGDTEMTTAPSPLIKNETTMSV
ncbi:uncharacterized protein F4807DRAFT_457058 [Annulohypoxylon truncatum]|uniref:uncharacterized protein n=1 Tax=Annulohypoxylon truncatum TaxID=327061 RepID=UPI00200729E9|nr:uncharacterized protein F4807DRAFT_457058 [Annulohypoxylon truncatum]KAI1212973.1 hypothetical protein F4807DRAFT_457058 [Annulohypoxylon truncatum]